MRRRERKIIAIVDPETKATVNKEDVEKAEEEAARAAEESASRPATADSNAKMTDMSTQSKSPAATDATDGVPVSTSALHASAAPFVPNTGLTTTTAADTVALSGTNFTSSVPVHEMPLQQQAMPTAYNMGGHAAVAQFDPSKPPPLANMPTAQPPKQGTPFTMPQMPPRKVRRAFCM